mgnify:CR=1 FL=1
MLAREMGFAQVSVSHEVSPLIKLVGRGDTTVVDAYLSPIIRRYVARVAKELQCAPLPGHDEWVVVRMDEGEPALRGHGLGKGSGGQRQFRLCGRAHRLAVHDRRQCHRTRR